MNNNDNNEHHSQCTVEIDSSSSTSLPYLQSVRYSHMIVMRNNASSTASTTADTLLLTTDSTPISETIWETSFLTVDDLLTLQLEPESSLKLATMLAQYYENKVIMIEIHATNETISSSYQLS